MILFKTIPFSCEDKDYEVKVFYSDTLINVFVFHKNYPANGFRHQIKVSKKFSVKTLLALKVIDEIVEIARKDIIEKRWERLLQAPTNVSEITSSNLQED